MNKGSASCQTIQAQFSSYLDGAVSGVTMQRIVAHLTACSECAAEFDGLRATQTALAGLFPVKAPADLSLRLRVAISNERARTPHNWLQALKVRWENTLAPLLLQALGGIREHDPAGRDGGAVNWHVCDS